MKRGFVMYSEEAGVYLGSFLGLGFWSKWDAAGQDSAVVFEDASAAQLLTALNPEAFPQHRLVEVDVDDDGYVSIESCVKAGLPAWDPNAPGLAELADRKTMCPYCHGTETGFDSETGYELCRFCTS